jgi:hypothetical protein
MSILAFLLRFSMWLLNRDSCFDHPMLPTAFAITNVLLGMISFELCHRAILHHKDGDLFAHSNWVWAYSFFFAILGMGYSRFLYAGDVADWAIGRPYPYLAFFQSEVFFALVVMGVFLLPALYVPTIVWFAQSYPTREAQRRVTMHVLHTTAQAILAISAGFTLYIYTVYDAAGREKISEGPYGPFAPLVGFYVAMTVGYFPLVVAPYALIDTASISRSKLARHPWFALEDDIETERSTGRTRKPAIISASERVFPEEFPSEEDEEISSEGEDVGEVLQRRSSAGGGARRNKESAATPQRTPAKEVSDSEQEEPTSKTRVDSKPRNGRSSSQKKGPASSSRKKQTR